MLLFLLLLLADRLPVLQLRLSLQVLAIGSGSGSFSFAGSAGSAAFLALVFASLSALQPVATSFFIRLS